MNILPIAAYSLWLSPFVYFWLQALGPFRSFSVAAPSEPAWPWLVLSLGAGAAALLLPRRYYRLSRLEKSGRLYRALGARRFRALVTNGDLVSRAVRRRYPDFRVHPFARRRDAVATNAVAAERSHLVALLAGVVATAYALEVGWSGWAAWLGATNLACNLYPVLLQRYTRTRLER